MSKKINAYLLGVLASYIVAVLLVSQLNIARIIEFGYSVTMSQRIQTAIHDIIGMASLYLPIIALALLIAWLFTRFLLNRFFSQSLVLYVLAGFVAIITVHVLLFLVFGMNPVAPTRSLFGLLSQGIAGAVGGWVYYRTARLTHIVS